MRNRKIIVFLSIFSLIISTKSFGGSGDLSLSQKVKSLNLHNLCKGYISSAIDNLPSDLKIYDDEFYRRNLDNQSCAKNEQMAQLLIDIKYLKDLQMKIDQEDKTIRILNSQLEMYKGMVEQRALRRKAQREVGKSSESEETSEVQNEIIIHRGTKGTYTQVGNISFGENGNAFRFGNVVIDNNSRNSGTVNITGNKSYGGGVTCIKYGALVTCN